MHYRRQILGVNVDFGLSYDETITKIEQFILDKVPGKYICTTNPEFIFDAQADIEFKNIINRADLSVPDGSGILYANAFLEQVSKVSANNKYEYAVKTFIEGLKVGLSAIEHPQELHATITGVELTDRLAALSAKKKYTIYLLGGGRFESVDSSAEMALETAKMLSEKYPGVNIIGGTSRFNREPEDDESTINYIKNDMREKGVSNIDILLVAYNHGFQDKWIARNAQKIPATVSMGVGRTFALLTGYQPKEPVFIEKLNLSWLYRLFTQPTRYKRILKAFPAFPFIVYKNNLKLYIDSQKVS